jgi:hypothetical protein
MTFDNFFEQTQTLTVVRLFFLDTYDNALRRALRHHSFDIHLLTSIVYFDRVVVRLRYPDIGHMHRQNERYVPVHNKYITPFSDASRESTYDFYLS